MSDRFLLALFGQVRSSKRLKGQRRPQIALEERCYLVVCRYSRRGAVPSVGRNDWPQLEPTPQQQELVRAMWPEGPPAEVLNIGGGAELIEALTFRLKDLVGARSNSCQRPRVSRGRRVEALLFD